MSKYTEGLAGQIVSYIEDDSYAIKAAKGRFEGKPVMTATRRPNGNRKKRGEKCYLCHFFLHCWVKGLR